MTDDKVVIKGLKDGILITLSPTEEWIAITTELATKIDKQQSFFAGARILIDVGERPVRKHELMSLKALLERRGMILSTVLSNSDTTLNAAQALDLRTTSPSPSITRKSNDYTAHDAEESGTYGVMIRRTLRSGKTVHSDGHVVVFGDVNPGAKIIAAGDIIVWGKLRGTVHAGSNGDETAVVCALDMNPTQLRLAHYIVTSPPDNRRKSRPEVAYVRDQQIVVEAWNG